MSDSVQPHRRQHTRLRHSWDSPGKNTGVGCHFLLQCMKVKSESEVAQSCSTLHNPMDCSLPGSFVHGIFPGKSTGVGCQPLLTEKKKYLVDHNNERHDLLVSLSCVNSKNSLGLFIHFLVELSSEKDAMVLDYLFFYISNVCIKGFPRWHSGKESTCQCRRDRRCSFDS